MDKLRGAVATVTEGVTRSCRLLASPALAGPSRDGDHEQQGQGLAEYALILALIAIVAIVALTFLGTSVTQLFEDIINGGFRLVLDQINP